MHYPAPTPPTPATRLSTIMKRMQAKANNFVVHFKRPIPSDVNDAGDVTPLKQYLFPGPLEGIRRPLPTTLPTLPTPAWEWSRVVDDIVDVEEVGEKKWRVATLHPRRHPSTASPASPASFKTWNAPRLRSRPDLKGLGFVRDQQDQDKHVTCIEVTLVNNQPPACKNPYPHARIPDLIKIPDRGRNLTENGFIPNQRIADHGRNLAENSIPNPRIADSGRNLTENCIPYQRIPDLIKIPDHGRNLTENCIPNQRTPDYARIADHERNVTENCIPNQRIADLSEIPDLGRNLTENCIPNPRIADYARIADQERIPDGNGRFLDGNGRIQHRLADAAPALRTYCFGEQPQSLPATRTLSSRSSSGASDPDSGFEDQSVNRSTRLLPLSASGKSLEPKRSTIRREKAFRNRNKHARQVERNNELLQRFHQIRKRLGDDDDDPALPHSSAQLLRIPEAFVVKNLVRQYNCRSSGVASRLQSKRTPQTDKPSRPPRTKVHSLLQFIHLNCN